HRSLPELGAQPRDVDLDRIRRDVVVPVRNRAQELLFRDDVAGIQHQAFEDGPFAVREIELLARGTRFLAREVELQAAEVELRAGDSVRATDQGATAGQ